MDKVVDVVGLHHNPPEKAVVLCVDERFRGAGVGPVPAIAVEFKTFPSTIDKTVPDELDVHIVCDI